MYRSCIDITAGDSKRFQLISTDTKSIQLEPLKPANINTGLADVAYTTAKLNLKPQVFSADSQISSNINPPTVLLTEPLKQNSTAGVEKLNTTNSVPNPQINVAPVQINSYVGNAINTASSQKPSVPQLSPEALAAASMLRFSMMFTPENMESEKNFGYTVRNLYSNAPPSYPTQPPSIQENHLLFEKIPMDSLFFAFYYQPGTYAQFLAAKHLKKHSWRFHKKYMTWFQRHEEPKVSSDEYEEGTYVYFDYESGWCQRIKSEFKFEYAYLEE